MKPVCTSSVTTSSNGNIYSKPAEQYNLSALRQTSMTPNQCDHKLHEPNGYIPTYMTGGYTCKSDQILL